MFVNTLFLGSPESSLNQLPLSYPSHSTHSQWRSQSTPVAMIVNVNGVDVASLPRPTAAVQKQQ